MCDITPSCLPPEQQAKGFRGRDGNTTSRLDGAIFSASNAALMLAQLGDLDGAVKEVSGVALPVSLDISVLLKLACSLLKLARRYSLQMERIARRAPGSVDMRAALAALYYDRGSRGRAEDSWEFACNKIVVGCTFYRDRDWLGRIRRWPPVMVEKMFKFLELKSPEP